MSQTAAAQLQRQLGLAWLCIVTAVTLWRPSQSKSVWPNEQLSVMHSHARDMAMQWSGENSEEFECTDDKAHDVLQDTLIPYSGATCHGVGLCR